MKRVLFTSLVLGIFLSQTLLAQSLPIVRLTSAERKLAEGVTARQLSDYLHFVASDEMEGRETPSRGLDLTAKFISMNLSRWGFKPAGDNGTFLQKFAVRRVPNPNVNLPPSFVFQAKEKYDPAAMSGPEYVTTQNVVAIWEGSDKVLKNEMVAIGAHYDHVGNAPPRCRPDGDDSICNGADDDGSGTVTLLSIAEALAKAPLRPRRSILFVWHAGEERGLWGSEYFNRFPTVDIKQVTAQLNIDMIGRSRSNSDTNPRNKDLTGPDQIYVIGKDMMSSTLGAIVDRTNKAYLDLGYDTKYDDPKDPNRLFFRSDHFHYAANGIPVTFWFDGIHQDYHQPGDHPDKIDYRKMEKVARTVLLTLWELTDLKQRPAIDKELPPELKQR